MGTKRDGFMPVLSQSNRITTARYSYSPVQKRCIYAIISEVRRKYIDKDLEEDEGVQTTLFDFDNLEVTLTPEQLMKLGDEVKDVRNAFRGLITRAIEVEKPDGGWEIMTWIMYGKSNRDGSFTVEVSKHLLPYVVELVHGFTSYELTVALSLKSTYSQRFYEFCCQFRKKGRFFFTVDELRRMMKLDGKETYDNYAAFNRRVILAAQKELILMYELGQSDLYFDYEVKDKVGKKVVSLWFIIHDKATEKQKILDYTEMYRELRRILECYIKRDKKFVERTINSLKLEPDKARAFLDKAYKVQDKYPTRDVPRLLRFILQDDFDLK